MTLVMTGSNPFRVRKEGNIDTVPVFSTAKAAAQSPYTPAIASNSYVKSSISLEREVDDSSSDSNPFNPDLSSDSDNEVYGRNPSTLDDRPPSFGSAPHLTPSTDGSSIPSSSDRNMRSTGIEPVRGITPDAPRDSFQHEIRQPIPSPQLETDVSPPRRKDRKPPPPPKSHHGRRISSTGSTGESSQRGESRLNSRLSSSDFPTNVTLGASQPGSGSGSLAPAVDHSSTTPGDSWTVMQSTNTPQRRSSRNKRPPTPPLSRRHSQMRRSQSTQSKHSRLTMSSYDSESNDGSRASSPGPSARSSIGKRVSMPPSSGDFPSTTPLADISLNTSPRTTSQPSSIKSGRRASSYGHSPGTTTGSTAAPPPPPPPRRARDSLIRSDDSVPLTENQPQPSNALDILADLTKLQKEVDDLRGHYENRKG